LFPLPATQPLAAATQLPHCWHCLMPQTLHPPTQFRINMTPRALHPRRVLPIPFHLFNLATQHSRRICNAECLHPCHAASHPALPYPGCNSAPPCYRGFSASQLAGRSQALAQCKMLSQGAPWAPFLYSPLPGFHLHPAASLHQFNTSTIACAFTSLRNSKFFTAAPSCSHVVPSAAT
jgi:hypothetical protein